MTSRAAHIIVVVFLSFLGAAQEVRVTPQDREIFESVVEILREQPNQELGKIMVQIGKSFLGTPYVANTLDDSGAEALIINLRELDCTTFVENVLVLSQLASKDKLEWGSYPEMLEFVRYRNGVRDRYPSRLHYFTEWIHNNAQKGLLEDITPQVQGTAHQKPIDFMGMHRSSYPALAQESNWDAIRNIEQTLSQEPLWILSQNQVQNQEHLLQDGDIIALATDISGLDVTHTGLAIRADDGRIHLLHASTVGKVVISEKPLADYLKGIKRNIGIIVARPANSK